MIYDLVGTTRIISAYHRSGQPILTLENAPSTSLLRTSHQIRDEYYQQASGSPLKLLVESRLERWASSHNDSQEAASLRENLPIDMLMRIQTVETRIAWDGHHQLFSWTDWCKNLVTRNLAQHVMLPVWGREVGIFHTTSQGRRVVTIYGGGMESLTSSQRNCSQPQVTRRTMASACTEGEKVRLHCD